MYYIFVFLDKSLGLIGGVFAFVLVVLGVVMVVIIVLFVVW